MPNSVLVESDTTPGANRADILASDDGEGTDDRRKTTVQTTRTTVQKGMLATQPNLEYVILVYRLVATHRFSNDVSNRFTWNASSISVNRGFGWTVRHCSYDPGRDLVLMQHPGS